MAGTAKDMLKAAVASIGMSGRPNTITKDYAKRHGNVFLTAPWCDMAITYWARQSGCTKSVLPGGDRAYTVWHAQDFQKAKRWTVGTKAGVLKAKPGDIVFFDWGSTDSVGAIDHVGIVEKNNGDGTLMVIEGNTSNACKRMKRSFGVIAGFGSPAYATAPPVVLPPPPPPAPGVRHWHFTNANCRRPLTVPWGVLSPGDTGEQIKHLQWALGYVGAGYLAHVSGTYGECTTEAVKAFQKVSTEFDGTTPLVEDGIYGHLTAQALYRRVGGPGSGDGTPGGPITL